MKPKVLAAKDLDAFVENLVKSQTVMGPTRTKKGICYKPIKDGKDLVLEWGNSLIGPKEFLFPQNEILVRFEGYVDSAVPVGEAEKVGPIVVFAARPCDARAIAILDKLFINEDYVDDYYRARREATTLICFSCNQPRPTCFCTSVGGGPFDATACDVAMARISEDYLVEALTEKGEKLVKDLPDADPSLLEKKEKLKKSAEESITTKLDLEGIPEKLKGMFEDPIWEEITDKCIGCGVCTYLCPTCHCFDIQDEAVDDNGKRIRNWDSCMFPIFTYHGSGHQPRDKRHQRMRQRIMHKFNYYVENFGVIACVGCGRCITECPTNEDLRDNLRKLKELEPAKVE
ncbi:4Fe-4S ferredoxin [candidate division TA06 bacterium]|uniref:4Fe-4S ferredoxin n=1 Tax=candidate division TA06 bacterium TaxID=2250710 RepID=A0A523UYG4_UNCT6|nr:MAG: 4Fe-4S ferredoxin [candidate division TA06 bacterium]